MSSSNIRRLSDELINKISAGEVVVSPASVIKELVENSIDAGATHVKVEVSEGGRKKIVVTDNGHGIRANELKLAFSKNATSKLQSMDMLEAIGTLGFRGEALFSISVVSKVSITTKHESEDVATYAKVVNGEVMEQKNVAFNTGTRIEIEDLFYNTPARHKHMKSAKNEKARSAEIVSKLALAHPEVAFSLYLDDKERFLTTGDGNLKNVISSVIGAEYLEKMIEVDYEDSPISVKGYALSPNYLDKQNEDHTLIINGRYIKNDSLNRSFNNIYREMFGLFSVRVSYVLYINIPYHFIDVNIHPAKTTIGFKNETLLTMLICEGLRSSLKKSINLNENVVKKPQERKEDPLKNQLSIGEDIATKNEVVEEKKLEPAITEKRNERTDFSVPVMDSFVPEESLYSETNIDDIYKVSENNVVREPAIPVYEREYKDKVNIVDKSIFDKILAMNFVGIAFKAYGMFDYGDNMYVIDTHAAHERVLYDKYMKKFKERSIDRQILLTPVVIELNAVNKQVFLNNLDIINKLGFDAEDFAGNNIILREIPDFLNTKTAKETILNVIYSLKDTSILTSEVNRNEKLIYTACHNAVRGKDIITKEDIYNLIEELKESDNPFSCPHSRPTISKIKKRFFEKTFQRI